MIAGSHDANESFHTIIHIYKRACLFPISPDLDLAAIFSESHLAANGSRCLFFPALVSTNRSVDVVKTRNPHVDAVILAIVTAELLSKKFFPAVARLGVCGKNVFLAKRGYVGVFLFALVVDTCRRREQKPPNSVLTTCVEHIGIN